MVSGTLDAYCSRQVRVWHKRGYPRQSHNQWQPESPDWRTERDPPAKASGMNALPLIANLRLCSSRAGTSREPSSALAKGVFPVAEAESLARLLPGWHQASQTRQRWSSPLFRFDMADWAASTVSPPAGNAFICTAALELLLDLVEHRKRVLEDLPRKPRRRARTFAPQAAPAAPVASNDAAPPGSRSLSPG